MSDMAGLMDLKKHFPLLDISSVVKLFKEQLEVSLEPDLAFLSIVVGSVENSLTCSRPLAVPSEESGDACVVEDDEFHLPPVEFHIVEALYNKFHAIIKGSVDLSLYDSKYATRELVKRVSDVIWNSLTRSYYKDRAHLQSLYSYLTGNKLDCFGVAFAVVAGCQVLGFRDVHLALSEDHAWVLFGPPGAQESAEVTWHDERDSRKQKMSKKRNENSGKIVIIESSDSKEEASVKSANPAVKKVSALLESSQSPSSSSADVSQQRHSKRPLKSSDSSFSFSSNFSSSSSSSSSSNSSSSSGSSDASSDGSPDQSSVSMNNSANSQYMTLKENVREDGALKGNDEPSEQVKNQVGGGASDLKNGKGNEDKRGQPVTEGGSEWLYLKGHAVECSRPMEVAALVSAINPSLNATSDAVEVALLQQELLWLLYDLGHLARYPMALGNLGDLEEICPTPGRPPCANLFQEAISSARTFYHNHHVYPYTYQGGFFYRHKIYKEAFESWANAADVIRKYNYSREDEEIYKEFLEIANELIPHIMKVVSSGHSARSILKDASCFARLLRFYDGICRWEEGSATPVLHIGWAKPLVNTISKFDAAVRARVDITLSTEQGNLNDSQPRRRASSDTCKYMAAESNNNYELIRSLESQVGSTPALPHPSIAALTEACGETLLNPGYLLRGIGFPFTNNRLLLAPATGSATATPEPDEAATPAEEPHEGTESDTGEEERPKLELHSHKMAGLKELLLSEKLNTHAISLQLTAQSQVQVGSRKTRADGSDAATNLPAAATTAAVPGARAKRARTRD